MDSLENWNFDKGATGRWTWSYVDPAAGFATKRSLQSFASLVECMNDATRNGYKSRSGRRAARRLLERRAGSPGGRA